MPASLTAVRLGLAIVGCLIIAAPSCAAVRLNQIQVLHTHNSYHVCPSDNMRQLFTTPIVQQAQESSPELDTGALEYHQPPLDVQLSTLGVRSFELDVYFDPHGGRYGYRAGPKLANLLRVSDDSFKDGEPDLFTPGWKTLHVPDLDFRSHCNDFASCLQLIGNWSRANPTHSPLFIAIELRTWRPSQLLPSSVSRALNTLLKFTKQNPKGLTESPDPDISHIVELEEAILTAFDRSQIYTPDEFRSGYPTMQERISTLGWPALANVTGKVMFRALGSGEYIALLETLRPGGMGGLMFVEQNVGSLPFTPSPNVIFAYVDMSIVPAVNATALAEAGIAWSGPASTTWTVPQWQVLADQYRQAVYLVVSKGQVLLRAAVDYNTAHARANFKGYGAAATAGGAHFLHTDYPAGTVSTCAFASPYTVILQQVRAGTWNRTAINSNIITTNWANKTNTRTLASVCNPVTAATTSCAMWTGAQPETRCTCYSLI